jgi:hypothetical protein
MRTTPAHLNDVIDFPPPGGNVIDTFSTTAAALSLKPQFIATKMTVPVCPVEDLSENRFSLAYVSCCS